MALTARTLERHERLIGPGQRQGALDLARRLPSLVVAAKEVASSAMHGVPGRRRNLLAVSPLRRRRVRRPRRLAALGAR